MALWKDFTGVVKNVFGWKPTATAGSGRFFGLTNSKANIAALKEAAYSTLEDGTLNSLDNAKYALFESQQLSALDSVSAVSLWANPSKLDNMNIMPTVESAITALSGMTAGKVYIVGTAIGTGLDNGSGGTSGSAAIGDLVYATSATAGFVLSRRMYSSMQLASGFTGTCSAIDTITAGAIYGNEGTKDLTGYTALAWKRRLISTTTIQNISGVMKYTIGGTGAAPTLTALNGTTGFPAGNVKPIEVSSIRVKWASANAATTLSIKDPGSAELINEKEILMLNGEESQKDDTYSYSGASTGAPTISGTGALTIDGTLWIFYSQVV